MARSMRSSMGVWCRRTGSSTAYFEPALRGRRSNVVKAGGRSTSDHPVRRTATGQRGGRRPSQARPPELGTPAACGVQAAYPWANTNCRPSGVTLEGVHVACAPSVGVVMWWAGSAAPSRRSHIALPPLPIPARHQQLLPHRPLPRRAGCGGVGGNQRRAAEELRRGSRSAAAAPAESGWEGHWRDRLRLRWPSACR